MLDQKKSLLSSADVVDAILTLGGMASLSDIADQVRKKDGFKKVRTLSVLRRLKRLHMQGSVFQISTGAWVVRPVAK